jgi:hypothetical protein
MNPYSFFILPKGGVVEKRSKRAKHLYHFCTKEKLIMTFAQNKTLRQPHNQVFVGSFLHRGSLVLETDEIFVSIAMPQETLRGYRQPFNDQASQLTKARPLVNDHGFTLLSPGTSPEAE